MSVPHYSILIVDDNPIDCAVFERYLKQGSDTSYTIATAQSAAEGLAFCREQHPDALVVDYGLPDDDGLEFLAALLAEHGAHSFAVVLLTGVGDEAVAVKAMQLGAQDYLVKGPQLETRLPIALASAIEKIALQQQVDQQRRELQASNQQLQEALAAQQASEQQLLLALQGARMATWEWDLTTEQVSWSAGLSELLGISTDARAGAIEPFFEMIHADDREHVRQELERALHTGTLPSTEFRMYSPVRGRHWLAAHGYVEHDEQGQPLRVIGIAMDINERKHAEVELRRRESQFKTLVENAPDIIARFDRNLRHLYVSPMIEHVTGMSSEVFLGKSNRELGMPDELCTMWEDRLGDVFESGKSQVIEFEFAMASGETRRFQSTLVPEFSDHGKIETVLSIVRDITEFVRAEDRLRFLADAGSALAASLDAQAALELLARLMAPQLADACTIDLVDDQHAIRPAVVVHVDPEMENALLEMRRRYPPTWGGAHPVAQVLQAGTSLIVDHIPRRMIDENMYDEQHRQFVQQLAPRSFLMVPFRVRGQLAGVITLYAMHMPRHYTDDDRTLVEELARRAAMALDNARLFGEAQEALRERDAFLSVASHELKNPLTSLLGRAQLMQRRLARMDDGARLADDAELIIGQARRISALLNDMLDMSRLESGQFAVDRVPLDLAALVNGVVSGLQASASEHELRLCAPPTPLMIAGDAGRLEQVFTNLLTNAIKYSPDGGTITIDMRADGNQALVAISDPGLGIPPEALPQLFKRFYRVVRDSTQHISGSGIGLYVVKEIVTGHGGTIDVASTVGTGSTFTVYLPLADLTMSGVPQEPEQSSNGEELGAK